MAKIKLLFCVFFFGSFSLGLSTTCQYYETGNKYGYCWKLMKGKASIDMAMHQCQTNMGQLPVINSLEKAERLAAFLIDRKKKLGRIKKVWLSRVHRDWKSTSELVNSVAEEKGGNCAIFHVPVGRWYLSKCKGKHHFVCEEVPGSKKPGILQETSLQPMTPPAVNPVTPLTPPLSTQLPMFPMSAVPMKLETMKPKLTLAPIIKATVSPRPAPHKGKCPSGYTPFKRTCFYLMPIRTRALQAQKRCRETGGSLVYFNNRKDLKVIRKYIKSLKRNKVGKVLINSILRKANGDYVWYKTHVDAQASLYNVGVDISLLRRRFIPLLFDGQGFLRACKNRCMGRPLCHAKPKMTLEDSESVVDESSEGKGKPGVYKTKTMERKIPDVYQGRRAPSVTIEYRRKRSYNLVPGRERSDSSHTDGDTIESLTKHFGGFAGNYHAGDKHSHLGHAIPNMQNDNKKKRQYDRMMKMVLEKVKRLNRFITNQQKKRKEQQGESTTIEEHGNESHGNKEYKINKINDREGNHNQKYGTHNNPSEASNQDIEYPEKQIEIHNSHAAEDETKGESSNEDPLKGKLSDENEGQDEMLNKKDGYNVQKFHYENFGKRKKGNCGRKNDAYKRLEGIVNALGRKSHLNKKLNTRKQANDNKKKRMKVTHLLNRKWVEDLIRATEEGLKKSKQKGKKGNAEATVGHRVIGYDKVSPDENGDENIEMHHDGENGFDENHKHSVIDETENPNVYANTEIRNMFGTHGVKHLIGETERKVGNVRSRGRDYRFRPDRVNVMEDENHGKGNAEDDAVHNDNEGESSHGDDLNERHMDKKEKEDIIRKVNALLKKSRVNITLNGDMNNYNVYRKSFRNGKETTDLTKHENLADVEENQGSEGHEHNSGVKWPGRNTEEDEKEEDIDANPHDHETEMTKTESIGEPESEMENQDTHNENNEYESNKEPDEEGTNVEELENSDKTEEEHETEETKDHGTQGKSSRISVKKTPISHDKRAYRKLLKDLRTKVRKFHLNLVPKAMNLDFKKQTTQSDVSHPKADGNNFDNEAAHERDVSRKKGFHDEHGHENGQHEGHDQPQTREPEDRKVDYKDESVYKTLWKWIMKAVNAMHATWKVKEHVKNTIESLLGKWRKHIIKTEVSRSTPGKEEGNHGHESQKNGGISKVANSKDEENNHEMGKMTNAMEGAKLMSDQNESGNNKPNKDPFGPEGGGSDKNNHNHPENGEGQQILEGTHSGEDKTQQNVKHTGGDTDQQAHSMAEAGSTGLGSNGVVESKEKEMQGHGSNEQENSSTDEMPVYVANYGEDAGDAPQDLYDYVGE